jgi:hypothetical protein
VLVWVIKFHHIKHTTIYILVWWYHPHRKLAERYHHFWLGGFVLGLLPGVNIVPKLYVTIVLTMM